MIPDRADAIIEQLLVGAAGGLRSTSRADGQPLLVGGILERAEEWLVLVKNPVDAGVGGDRAVVGAHPYDMPEVVALDIVDGSPGYLEWITEVTTGTA